MPTWLLFAVIVIGSVMIGGVMTFVSRRWVPRIAGEGHNEVAGLVFSAVGAVYGVILAFVVVTAWDNFTTADRAVSQESAVMIATYQNTFTFPEPVRQISQQRILAYADSVAHYEWPAMSQGESSPKTTAALQGLFRVYGRLRPATSWQAIMYEESFTRLNDLAQARAARLQAGDVSIPPLFWILLIGGGVVTVALAAAFSMERWQIQLGLVAVLAAVIGTALAVILVLDHPFAGQVHVDPGPLLGAIDFLSQE